MGKFLTSTKLISSLLHDDWDSLPPSLSSRPPALLSLVTWHWRGDTHHGPHSEAQRKHSSVSRGKANGKFRKLAFLFVFTTCLHIYYIIKSYCSFKGSLSINIVPLVQTPRKLLRMKGLLSGAPKAHAVPQNISCYCTDSPLGAPWIRQTVSSTVQLTEWI